MTSVYENVPPQGGIGEDSSEEEALTGIRPRLEREDADELPAILNIEAKRVHYDPPRESWQNHKIVKIHDGVELLVQFASALPARALSPVLYIGDIAVAKYVPEGQNRYRFFIHEPQALQPGAPIALAWPHVEPDQRIASNFRFQIRDVAQA